MSQVEEEHTVVSTRAPSLASKDEKNAAAGGVSEKDDAEAQSHQASKPDFPEGGLRGWGTLLGAWVHRFHTLKACDSRSHSCVVFVSSSAGLGTLSMFSRCRNIC